MKARLALLALLLGACGHRSEIGTMPTLAIDLVDGPNQRSFDRMVAVAAAMGYPLEFSSPQYGVFGVQAHVPTGPDGATSFVVQCYADGGAVLTVLGGVAVPGTERTRVSSRIRTEAVTLAQALERGEAP